MPAEGKGMPAMRVFRRRAASSAQPARGRETDKEGMVETAPENSPATRKAASTRPMATSFLRCRIRSRNRTGAAARGSRAADTAQEAPPETNVPAAAPAVKTSDRTSMLSASAIHCEIT